MSKHNEKAGSFFKEHPLKKVVYITEDGFMFENANFASQHNSTLGEGVEFETHVNPNVKVVDAEDASQTLKGIAATQGNTANADAPKVVKLKDLNKAQLIQYAKDNDLSLDESLTNAKMVESIEAQLEAKANTLKSSEGTGTEAAETPEAQE